jgi:hypothetical protein
MAFNRSQDVERRHVLARPLHTFSGHVLQVRCPTPSCGGVRQLWIDALLGRWGERPMNKVVATLRCTHCLQPAAWVMLRRPVYPGQLRQSDLTLVLLGGGLGPR